MVGTKRFTLSKSKVPTTTNKVNKIAGLIKVSHFNCCGENLLNTSSLYSSGIVASTIFKVSKEKTPKMPSEKRTIAVLPSDLDAILGVGRRDVKRW